ncbi:MAG: iron donor protein CyaY [Zoogloeaceae bacterium]|nr:iron donor protein CyaY [Zoogloeaceae bacterium]
MNESEFNALAGATLSLIEQKLDACDADVDYELVPGGVLELEFADGSKIIVNKHVVAQEIWVAARSGGFHFRRDGEVWRDTRDGSELLEKLGRLVTAQAGEEVVFS